MRALIAHGEDVVGNLLLGDVARERFINAPLPVPVDRSQYPTLAEAAERGDVPGSSAGGEQPKFTAFAGHHVIVKFTAADAGPVARRWRDLLVRQRAIVRAELARFDGREADCFPTGFQVSFDGPARALRFAGSVRRVLRDQLRLEICAGAHTGECSRSGEQLSGPALEVGAAVLKAAQAGEVLATSAVRELGAGSGIALRELGAQVLAGVPGRWDLYALED